MRSRAVISKSRLWQGVALLLVPVLAGCSAAGSPAALRVEVAGPQGAAGQATVALEVVGLLTLLSFLPAALMMTTSFTRIIIVLGFLRSGLGLPQLPPNQVLIGLALFLTVFTMAPTWDRLNREALQPYLRGEVGAEEAWARAEVPVKAFMLRQTHEQDLALFVELARLQPPADPAALPLHVVIPAFILSELRTAFQMGFVILVPFLVIDLVVSSVLMAMGMMMMPPVIVSLPFKILLFVLVDGWTLVVRSVVQSFV